MSIIYKIGIKTGYFDIKKILNVHHFKNSLEYSSQFFFVIKLGKRNKESKALNGVASVIYARLE